jgi:hypothetical protein
MTVKSHVVVAKLAKTAEAFLKPDVAAKWPEANEHLFRIRPDGRIRSIAGDLKVKQYFRSVLKDEMPSLFLDNPVEKVSSKTNPWGKDSWDSLKQQSIVKSLGAEKASAIAKAANPPSFVGANKPGQKNLTSQFEKGPDGRVVRSA